MALKPKYPQKYEKFDFLQMLLSKITEMITHDTKSKIFLYQKNMAWGSCIYFFDISYTYLTRLW